MMIAGHFVPEGVSSNIELTNIDCGKYARVRDIARRTSLFKSRIFHSHTLDWKWKRKRDVQSIGLDSIFLWSSELYWKTVYPFRTNWFSLALMQLRLAVTLFVWHFDAEFAEKGQAQPYYKDAFVALRGPLPVRISVVKRNGEWKSVDEAWSY